MMKIKRSSINPTTPNTASGIISNGDIMYKITSTTITSTLARNTNASPCAVKNSLHK